MSWRDAVRPALRMLLQPEAWVEDADPGEGIDPEALAAVCRGWSRA
ncbi:hypothetical protein ABT096_29260 [Streptomyces sp. NPDC002561]